MNSGIAALRLVLEDQKAEIDIKVKSWGNTLKGNSRKDLIFLIAVLSIDLDKEKGRGRKFLADLDTVQEKLESIICDFELRKSN